MCHLTRWGFRSLESCTGYSPCSHRPSPLPPPPPKKKKKIGITIDTLNSAKLVVLRKNYLCQTSTRHRKNPKQGGIVALDSCFAIIVARQDSASTERTDGLMGKYLLTLFSALTLNSNTHRITPSHVSPEEQESRCRVYVWQRKCK